LALILLILSSVSRGIFLFKNSLSISCWTVFILATHDLRTARRFCQRLYVMKQGTVVEHNSVKALFEHPEYAYTRELIDAMELKV